MSITIHTISAKNIPNWVETGYETYAKRLTGVWSLKTLNTPLRARTNPKNIEAERTKESQDLLCNISDKAQVIALDETGRLMDSNSFAHALNRSLETFQQVHFIIGGPEGLTPALKERSNQTWSLSQLTFPHTLAKILLCEQIYRAWSIIHHHPYHNE